MQSILSVSTTLRPDLALTGLFALVYLATAVYASAVRQGGQNWWITSFLLAALAVIALQMKTSVFGRTLLLDLAALSAVGMVWSQANPRAKNAARIYLAMLLFSMACTLAGIVMGGLQVEESAAQLPVALVPPFPANQIVAALLIIGFSIKLALVPLYFWLPAIAESSSAMTTALVVGILDMAEFGELLALRQSAPWIFTDHYLLWFILALLTMFGGALLALAQHDLKRMLAFSTIDDMGYLLLAVLIGTDISLTGAVYGVISHALFKTLLFGAVGIAEKNLGEPINLSCRGLATRFPVSSAMFITGALGILGIPPLVGFSGRWRIYLAAIQTGGPLLGAALALATGLALLYYVRAIHRVWLGQSPGAELTPSTAEPRPATAALVVLAVVALALGLFPGLLQIML